MKEIIKNYIISIFNIISGIYVFFGSIFYAHYFNVAYYYPVLTFISPLVGVLGMVAGLFAFALGIEQFKKASKKVNI